MVPHELSEQEFWSRFFQSHYFHRERNPAEPSTSSTDETFADCAKMDERGKNLLRTILMIIYTKNVSFLSICFCNYFGFYRNAVYVSVRGYVKTAKVSQVFSKAN